MTSARRPAVQPGQPLPAWLSIADVARLCGDKHRNSVRRLLEAANVPLVRTGRKLVVMTSVLRRRMPDLVTAIEDRRLEDVSEKPPVVSGG